MNLGENFSNIGLIDSQSCAQRTNGLGFMKDGYCIFDYSMMFNFTEAAWVTSIEINETEGCAELYVNDTSEGCLSDLGNISISGRVMWMEYLDHAEGPDGVITTSHCLVFIASPEFVTSSQYNRTHNTDEEGMDWNDLWADPEYEQWENERMSAYSVEETNAPSWCTTNIHFDAWYWMTSPADTTPDPVQYVGFLDNSSIWGYKINPIENFSRIYVAMNEENCTSTSEGDDFLGIWNDPLCVTDYGQMVENVTYSNGGLCFEEGGSSGCFNMTISGRVMWFDGGFGGDGNSCQVFIQSEQFIPSSSYILSLNTISSGAPDWEYIPVDWDQLWADPAYIAWDAERMAAYNDEVSSQPAWCTDPIFDAVSWTS